MELFQKYKELRKQQWRFLNAKIVKDFYAGRENMMMAHGPHLKNTAMQPIEHYPSPKRKYGLEMEVKLRDWHWMTPQDTAYCVCAGMRLDMIKRGYGAMFDIRYDGSVQNGFEIITGAMPFQTLVKLLRTTFLKFGMEWLGETNEATGLHITVDPFLKEQHALLFYQCWHDERFHAAFGHIIGRPPNRFCKLLCVPTWHIAKNQTKYGAANVRKNGAIEVRSFRYTNDLRSTITQLVLVDAAVEVVQKRGVKSVEDVIAYVSGMVPKNNEERS